MDRFLNQTKAPNIPNGIKTVQENSKNSVDALSLCPQKVVTLYSCDLAFTITLKPVEYRKTYEDQYSGTAYLLTSIFNAGGCKYTMVAELTKQYNIHYHGIMKIPKDRAKDPIKWFFDRLRLLQFTGRCECEQVKNYDKWTTYIIKDIQRDIDIRTVIKDDYNICKLSLLKSEGESGTSPERA